MIAWFAKNSVAANLLMFSIVIAGIFSMQRIPLEVFPSFASDYISVNMSLRGATPEDVEKGLTIRIEEAVQDLEGIKEISSTSSEGSASVVIEVDSNYNPRDLLADIKSRVDSVNTFPADAEKAIIALDQEKHEVMGLTLASEYGEVETLEYAEEIRNDLLQLPEVTQVEISGVRDYEIAIEVAQDKLRQYKLTLAEVSDAIAKHSVDISAGNLKTTGGDILVRTKSQAYRKDEFSNIPVKSNADGSIIYLGDIAIVTDGFEETPVRTKFNGKSAVYFDIYRMGNQNAIEVADAAKAYIAEKKSSLPKGFELTPWDDDSLIVKKRISTLTSSAIQGGILVLALLTLFLRPAIAFWVFIGIPVCFLGAFLIMPMFGVTINVLSLFGFILVLGIVVDDAIVTGENIYTHLKTSESGEQAAIKGTQEVSAPVTFGVLTTITAFMPLAFLEGDRSAFFSQIPFVVIPVLIFSLIESKLVLPSHLKHLKLRSNKAKESKFNTFQRKFADGFEASILKYYKPILATCLRNKATTLLGFISIFAVTISLVTSGWTQFTFFPRIVRETVSAKVTMPVGTPFEVTYKHIEKISRNAEILRDKYIDEETGESIVTNILTRVGGRGGVSHTGSVKFEITPPEDRKMSIDAQQLANEWRKLTGIIPGAEKVSYTAEFGNRNSPIDVQLSGADLKTLAIVSDKIKQELLVYPTVFDITDTLSDGKEQLTIVLTDQAKALGISELEITRQVRNALFGAEAQRIQRGRDDVRVMVRLPIDERRSIAELETLLIQTASGTSVPLSHIAKLVPNKGPATINRINLQRTVNVLADVDKKTTNMALLQADLSEAIKVITAQYPNVRYSLEGEAKEQRETLGSLKWALVFSFFAIYVLLAIPFKSYVQPLIVMSIIPFGIVGAILGHWLLGMNLTLLSLLGMLALTGVVVNDSLVLVDYINKTKEKHSSLLEAVSVAGSARFRPVILTSLTTFIGLIPLLFEESTQAQFLIPMAVSLAFGILFATLITLVLVPVNYMLVEKARNTVKGFVRKES